MVILAPSSSRYLHIDILLDSLKHNNVNHCDSTTSHRMHMLLFCVLCFGSSHTKKTNTDGYLKKIETAEAPQWFTHSQCDVMQTAAAQTAEEPHDKICDIMNHSSVFSP